MKVCGVLILILAVWCVGVPVWADPITPEEEAHIKAALPSEPVVPPRQARKLLVFTRCRGFVHSAIPYGSRALELMGEKTGAFEAVVTDDLAVFTPEKLAQFDAILFNNTTGDLFAPDGLDQMTAEEREAALDAARMRRYHLLSYVSRGGGIAGIHAATDCFYDWPEYGQMIGGYFAGHPWNEEVTIKVEGRSHAINAVLDQSELVLADEIYQFRSPYSRNSLRVLLSLDTDKTNMNKGDAINREDGDFAVAWVRRYGDGRVYYNSLGHRHEVFWNPAVLRHYLAGIQFALGDLEADMTPSARVGQASADE